MRGAWADLPMPCTVSGTAMLWPTVRRGFRDAPGFWNTICTGRAPRGGSTTPSIRIVPLVGAASPMIIRAMVDLPDPLSPASP